MSTKSELKSNIIASLNSNSVNTLVEELSTRLEEIETLKAKIAELEKPKDAPSVNG
jgi:hypothetical protein